MDLFFVAKLQDDGKTYRCIPIFSKGNSTDMTFFATDDRYAKTRKFFDTIDECREAQRRKFMLEQGQREDSLIRSGKLRYLSILLVLGLFLASCSTDTGDGFPKSGHLKKVAVQEIFQSSSTLKWHCFEDVQIKWVDTMYHIQDTLQISDKYYVIRRD